eukprot:6207429-Pleurochrysis_carterae.AAC.1
MYMIFKLKIAKPIYEKNSKNEDTENIIGYTNEIIYSRTKPGVIANVTSDLTQYFKYWISEIFASNRYQTNVVEVFHIHLHVARYAPDLGGTYCELPKAIQVKKACVNPENKDNKCFLYCVCMSMLDVLPYNPQRVVKYDLSTLKYKEEWFAEGGISPQSQSILFFEKMNNVCVNVYSCDKDGHNISPCRLTKQNFEKCVSLLYYNNHYVYIKNWQRLVGTQGKNLHTCERCLTQFSHKSSYELHIRDCRELQGKQRVTLPSPKDATCQFSKWSTLNRLPIVVYGDFECLNRKLDATQNNTGT